MEAHRLSRGAQRCLDLLQWYRSRFPRVYPYQSTLARHLKRKLRQTAYYLQELKQAGLIDVIQCGPGPAEYMLLKAVDKSVENQQFANQNCIAIAQQLHSFEAASINEFKSSSIQAAPAAMIQSVENYLGDYRIGGRVANRALIRRLATLLKDEEGVRAFYLHLRQWSLRNTAQSWGIIVRLAEDVAGMKGKPIQREEQGGSPSYRYHRGM